MTFAPQYTLESSLPENVAFSEDYNQFLLQITRYYKDLARKINDKTRGFYPQALEILNCERFFTIGKPQIYREVFRKAFPIGGVATGATLNTAHGLTGVTEYTRIYGTCITDVVDYRPLPRVSTVALNQQISLDIVGANIVLINGGGGPNITSGIIVVEFLKQ